MAVDEKYAETVKDEETMEDMLKEMGIDAHYQAPTESNIDFDGYDVLRAKDLPVGDKFVGNRVEISDIYLYSFEDKFTGEKTENNRIDFVIFDDDSAEAYIKVINLQSAEYMQEKVYGKLNDLAFELMELQMPGVSKSYNRLDKVNIKYLQKFVKQYESMTLKVVKKTFKDKDGAERDYSDFVIVAGTLKK